jgi:hypothetical protein
MKLPILERKYVNHIYLCSSHRYPSLKPQGNVRNEISAAAQSKMKIIENSFETGIAL